MSCGKDTCWADKEFSEVALGDKRLNARLVKLCNSFSEAPESSINQACEDWAETKAAYRFFKNDNVESRDIVDAHSRKTAIRASNYETVLAIQDTSYFVYTNHPNTKGLGLLGSSKGKKKKEVPANGLLMHSCLAVTTEGTPLGLLDQKIYSREDCPEKKIITQGGKNTHKIPLEKKESFRWVETMKAGKKVSSETIVVNICDREADFYEFFLSAENTGAKVLVRAAQNRKINRLSSKYSPDDGEYLWEYVASQSCLGRFDLNIPEVKKAKNRPARSARRATMEVKYVPITMGPPTTLSNRKTENLAHIRMYAVHALERNPPEGEEAVEWMLLTNMPVSSFKDACERVRWYGLRWRIEMFFKVLKSGLRVENCCLGTADRLIRYLTVMSVIAWRLFMITLIARTDPSLPCCQFLSEHEWRVLKLKFSKNKQPSNVSPTIGDAVIWIARLGGYLARKNDPAPGTTVLWRGWKRLMDMTEGWMLGNMKNICG